MNHCRYNKLECLSKIFQVILIGELSGSLFRWDLVLFANIKLARNIWGKNTPAYFVPPSSTKRLQPINTKLAHNFVASVKPIKMGNLMGTCYC
jgi:hypothetical protein